MKKARINDNLSKYTDANLEIKSQLIAANFEESPYFKNPTPAIAVLLAAIGAFSLALTASAGGDRYKIAEKNERREELEAVLSKLAAYATMVAEGDRTKLMSLGYDLEKPDEPQEVVPVETIKVISGANSGEMIVRVAGAKNVKAYIFAYTPDPATDSSKWEEEIDTKVKHSFKGLKPATKYCIRVAVIGKGGVKIDSQIVTYIVQ